MILHLLLHQFMIFCEHDHLATDTPPGSGNALLPLHAAAGDALWGGLLREYKSITRDFLNPFSSLFLAFDLFNYYNPIEVILSPSSIQVNIFYGLSISRSSLGYIFTFLYGIIMRLPKGSTITTKNFYQTIEDQFINHRTIYPLNVEMINGLFGVGHNNNNNKKEM